MALRIPLTPDMTLQTEFHEIERRLRKLEKVTGTASNSTTIKVVGGGGGAVDLSAIYSRLAALESAVAQPVDLSGLAEFQPAGDGSSKGLVPAPDEAAPPTGLADQYLEEDGTWSWPFRGLFNVATQGNENGYGGDTLNLLGSLGILGNFSAQEIECLGVNLPGDYYQTKSEFRDLVMPVTDGTQTQPPYNVIDVQGGLHVAGDFSAADAELFNLHTHGDIEYCDSFFDDLRFPATGFNPAGSTAPPAVLTTNGLLSFSGTADNIIGGVAQMPHSWKLGSAISPHIHLVFPTANAGTNTRWKLEYNVGNIDGDFTTDSVTYTALTTITVANANNIARHILAEFDDIPMTGVTMSACVLWRLTRLAASDAADNDTNACTLIEFDLHYEIDSPGSSAEYVK